MITFFYISSIYRLPPLKVLSKTAQAVPEALVDCVGKMRSCSCAKKNGQKVFSSKEKKISNFEKSKILKNQDFSKNHDFDF